MTKMFESTIVVAKGNITVPGKTRSNGEDLWN